MKKIIIRILEFFRLVSDHPSAYWAYYMHKRREIYASLKQKGLFKIRPTSMDQWKIYNNISYYSAQFVDDQQIKQHVFVKSYPLSARDVFLNEVTVNNYIDEHSPYLSRIKPKVLLSFEEDDRMFVVYVFTKLDPVVQSEALRDAMEKAVREYTRIGVIHTDLGLVNIGLNGEEFYFFDYGTSICPLSDRVRIRNSPRYNHLDDITDKALSLSLDPDFYYDDVIHSGIVGIDRSQVNFLVAKGNVCFARLGDLVVKYDMIKKNENSAVKLLVMREQYPLDDKRTILK